MKLPTRGRSRFGSIVCLIGIWLATIGLIVGYLGNLSIWFDAFSHLRLHFMVALLALISTYIAAVPFRVPVGIGMMVLGMLAIGNWHNLVPAGSEAKSVNAENHRVLKVMHFNTWIWNKDLEVIKAEIERTNPDVVFLAEYDSQKHKLAAMLKDAYPYMLPEKPVRHVDLALFSKVPFVASHVQGDWIGPKFIKVQLGADWGGVNIVGVHTIRPPRQQAQKKQLTAFGQEVAKIDGPVIVMGDFNATPFSAMLDIFRKETGLRRITTLPTWPASVFRLPQLAIDHIFLSDDVQLVQPAKVGLYAGSDHYPVSTIVSVPIRARVTEYTDFSGYFHDAKAN